jgi:hypothetical protein
MIDETPQVTRVDEALRLKMRSGILYPIFLGGGGYEMLYQDQWTMGGSITYETLAPMLDDMRIAREFVESLPFAEMEPNNALLSDPKAGFCLAKAGAAYGVYLKNGGNLKLDLRDVTGDFQVQWYNVTSAEVSRGPIIEGGDWRSLGQPPFTGDVACAIRVAK